MAYFSVREDVGKINFRMKNLFLKNFHAGCRVVGIEKISPISLRSMTGASPPNHIEALFVLLDLMMIDCARM